MNVEWTADIAIAGAGSLALGGLACALPRGLRAGLAAQTLGAALLGAGGAAVLLGDDAVGAAFRSDAAPALGVDPLSGFFLVVLALAAVPALVFARGYLSDDPAG